MRVYHGRSTEAVASSPLKRNPELFPLHVAVLLSSILLRNIIIDIMNLIRRNIGGSDGRDKRFREKIFERVRQVRCAPIFGGLNLLCCEIIYPYQLGIGQSGRRVVTRIEPALNNFFIDAEATCHDEPRLVSIRRRRTPTA